MHLRRPASRPRRRPAPKLAVAATAILALAVPLSSCGFDAATNRDYNPGSGTNNRDGVVKVLSAVVVSGQDGSGTVITSLANSDTEDEHSLASISGEGLTVPDFDPIAIEPEGLVNLAEPPADITVTGDFHAGDVVGLSFVFDSGETATLDVPVVTDDSGYWEGLDAS
jgi:hypothetical protein